MWLWHRLDIIFVYSGTREFCRGRLKEHHDDPNCVETWRTDENENDLVGNVKKV